MKVKECMCNDVCCVNANTNIYEVAKLMNDNDIGSIPVCDNNNCICGIVTDRDILLRSVVCDKDLRQTPIKDIMTPNVCTCKQDDEMLIAEKKMSESQIRRLPVCDSNNRIVGILTLSDLTQNNEQIGKQQVFKTIENICDCNSQSKNDE